MQTKIDMYAYLKWTKINVGNLLDGNCASIDDFRNFFNSLNQKAFYDYRHFIDNNNDWFIYVRDERTAVKLRLSF